MPHPQLLPRTATFLHALYSPKGGVEGVLVDLDGERVQFAFRHEPPLEEIEARGRRARDGAGAVAPLAIRRRARHRGRGRERPGRREEGEAREAAAADKEAGRETRGSVA